METLLLRLGSQCRWVDFGAGVSILGQVVDFRTGGRFYRALVQFSMKKWLEQYGNLYFLGLNTGGPT
jgi:hypothetical protein